MFSKFLLFFKIYFLPDTASIHDIDIPPSRANLSPFVHDFVFLLSSGVTVFDVDKDEEHGLEGGLLGGNWV